MDYGRIIGGVVIIVVGAVLLYYLYDYLFNIGSIQKKAEIVAGPVASSATIADYPSGGTKLNQVIYTGGEMGVSFWMYVTGAQTNAPNKLHVFHIGTSSDATTGNVMGVLLGSGANNALYIYISEGENFNINSAIDGTTDPAGRCHITNFEFGRWVNVTIVLNNNTCDVYVDGKLSRSCVLKGQFLVPSAASPDVLVYTLKKSFGTKQTGWNGSLSGFSLYNYALSPDEVYRIYFAGPSGSSGDLWAAIKSFFGAGGKVAAALPAAATTGLPSV